MTLSESHHPNPTSALADLHDALLNLLESRPDGWSEHELIRHLSQPPYAFFEPDCLRHSFSLFHTHFLLFHVLYQVRDQLEGQGGRTLEISALRVRILPDQQRAAGIESADPLEDYYRNWDNLTRTSPDDVEAMLDGFWRRLAQPRYQDMSEIRQALATLELEPASDYAAVKQQYRRLAMRHHPDRGGDVLRLQAINAAKFILDRHFRNGVQHD